VHRFDTRSLLGESLLGQGKSGEAEPLLLSGFEGLKAREARIPADQKGRVAEAGERIVRLYESVGKSAEADRWRKQLDPARANPSADAR
jgi:hypothetical protein